MLLDSPEINAIESRFISLYDRTLKRGILGNPGTLKQSFKKQFKSATFRIQLDKILNDLCLFTVKYTDSLINEQLTASLSPNQNDLKLFASREALPLTEVAVRQSIELSEVVAESIIRTLKDEGIYQENPRVLARKMLDIWGGEKYRAERFARTFSADVATSTTLVRYKQQGIEECQFYATIDSRTSPQCRMMHGTVFKTDSPELDRYKCPLHPHCRSSVIPVTQFSNIDDSLRYENRNFEKPVSQNFKPLKDELDKDLVNGTFKNIDKFNDKYRIDKFILDEDIEKRLMKLGVGVEGEVPKTIKKVQKVEIKRTPEEVQKVIKDHEAKIKINDYETGTIFDKNGNILINLKGGESRVTFEDAKLFKGNILTHNHPQHLGGGSFSKQDIITACKTSVSEVRVVDMNTAYIMKLKNGGNFSEELLEKIQPAYDKHYSDIVSKLSADVRSGKTTLEKAEAIAQNRIWTRVAYDIKEIDYKLDLLDV